MAFMIPRSFFKVLNLMERVAAYAQGKGYGSATIEQEVHLLRPFLQGRCELAIDIGGNVGDYTAELRRKNSKSEIHVFEPSAANVAKLGARFKGDELIKLVPFAVSDKSGSATLYSDESGSGLGSLTKRRLDHFSISFDAAETIETVRFESYWREQLRGRQLDMVKIDVEGHELAVLKGFGEALDVTRIIQFEFGGCNIDTRTYFQDFWYFFSEQNFDIYRITPFGLEKIIQYMEGHEFFSTTNYLAVNRRLFQAGS
jgi:FkbM family methyltransferase